MLNIILRVSCIEYYVQDMYFLALYLEYLVLISLFRLLYVTHYIESILS